MGPTEEVIAEKIGLPLEKVKETHNEILIEA